MTRGYSSYKWTVLGVGFLLNSINSWLISVMSAVLPSLVRDLSLSPVQAGWLMSASTLPWLFAPFLGGVIVDKFEAKWVVGLMAVIAGFGGVLRGLIPTFAGIFGGTFLVLLAIGFEWPGLVKVSVLGVSERNGGLALGILIAGYMVNSALVLVLTPLYIIPLLGSWASAFILISIIAILVGFIWIVFVKNPSKEGHIKSAETVPAREALGRLILQRDLWFIGGMQLLGSIAMTALTSFLPLTLILLAVPEPSAYIISSIYPLASMVGNIIGPALSDRVGARKLFLLPWGITCFIGILLVGISGFLPLILLGVVITGFYMGVATPLISAIPLEHPTMGPTLAGTATGFLGCVGSLGGTIGQLVYAWMLEISGVKAATTTIGAICLGIILFTIPLSETGHKRRAI